MQPYRPIEKYKKNKATERQDMHHKTDRCTILKQMSFHDPSIVYYYYRILCCQYQLDYRRKQ